MLHMYNLLYNLYSAIVFFPALGFSRYFRVFFFLLFYNAIHIYEYIHNLKTIHSLYLVNHLEVNIYFWVGFGCGILYLSTVLNL